MKQLPLGIQTYRKIADSNALYIDKTKHIYELISSLEYVFLSRPRRFGKSLLVSTIEEIFLGSKELFKNTYIYDKIDWEKHPVIKISFAEKSTDNAKAFEQSIKDNLNLIFSINGLENDKTTIADSFKHLIISLKEKYNQKVVILIDEYDKPINSNMEKPELLEELKQVIRAFYSVIKDNDQYIRFMFVTGVSKLAKVSLFSELNQMTDISLYEKYATMLGLTEEELTENFEEYFQMLQDKYSISRKEVRDTLKKWYNGYSWDGKGFVYNPFSILSALDSAKILNYWYESGTSKPLMQLIEKDKISIEEINNKVQTAGLFEGTEITDMTLTNLMFQTGYLTVKEVKVKGMQEKYLLDYPNHEVKESLYKHIIGYITKSNAVDVEAKSIRMRQAFLKLFHIGIFQCLSHSD